MMSVIHQNYFSALANEICFLWNYCTESFFQINTATSELLFNLAKDLASIKNVINF